MRQVDISAFLGGAGGGGDVCWMGKGKRSEGRVSYFPFVRIFIHTRVITDGSLLPVACVSLVCVSVCVCVWFLGGGWAGCCLF